MTSSPAYLDSVPQLQSRCPSFELSRAFVASTRDAVFAIDAATSLIVFSNAQAVRATGYTPEELLGMHIDQVLKALGDTPPASHTATTFRAGPDTTRWQLSRKNLEGVPVNLTGSAFEWHSRSCFLLIVRGTAAATAPDAAPPSTDEVEGSSTIIGRSPGIRNVCRYIAALAKSDTTVLIQGESGTGKEVVAEAVHCQSRRGRRPLVKVNCAALAETLIESELFGHVKGAFTGALRDRRGRFQQAEGGTLFLDEIGSMSLTGQAKLLRVLQEREFEPVGSSSTVPVDVRVIAATNTDLAKAIAEGRFREDLYYRLNVFPIRVPPLRERREDIALLALHFLRQYASRLNKEVSALAPETLQCLVEHAWPGNVRELENVIEHAVIIEESANVLPTSLPQNLRRDETSGASSAPREAALRDKLIHFEKQILLDALARSNGIKKRAAAILGVDARNLPYLLRKHKLLV